MTKVKLPNPPPDDGTRAEHEAFLTGFDLAIEGIKKALPSSIYFDDIEKLAKQLADDLYPQFYPLPEPVKRSDDGNRKDGIVME